MALQKQGVTVNFAQGLDTKTDPNQLAVGKFTSLVNSIFDTLQRLTKRNGYTALPVIGSTSFLTSYKGSLIAISANNIQTYAPNISDWINLAPINPVDVNTISLPAGTGASTAIAPNGLMCMTFNVSDFRNTVYGSYQYTIVDYNNGQVIVPPTVVSNGSQHFNSRVLTFNNNFAILYDQSNAVNSVSSLNVLYIPWATPKVTGSVSVISSSMMSNSTLGFDAVIASSSMYLSWKRPSGVDAAFVNPALTRSPITFISPALINETTVSVTADVTQSSFTYWTAFSAYNGSVITMVPTNQNLASVGSSFLTVSSGSLGIVNTSLVAFGGVLTTFFETGKFYSFDPTIPSNRVNKITATISGVVSSESVVARSVGMASKAFVYNSASYFLGTYSSQFQSTYFLMSSTGGVIAKIAYQNGGGYVNTGLPAVNVVGSTASVAYAFKNFIEPVNKLTNVSSQTQTLGIYTAFGNKLAKFTYTNTNLLTKELSGTMNFNGGFLGTYDGAQFVENNFFLYPDSVRVVASSSIGALTAQTYNYQVIYEWTDNQNNIYRSAPSIPASAIIGGSTNANFISVPTPRISYKTTVNPMRMSTYRWSTGQQIYYKIGPSIVVDASVLQFDSITFADVTPDTGIVGNEILYTNGGSVVENVNGPASTAMTIFDDRLFVITAEDQNLLWYSKQIIENTPVDMSDLFTIYVSPSIGAEGPTGVMKCIFPMDDKLIIFKKNAIYYINGSGPSNTGANSQYSQPIFVTTAVGCSNQDSIVLVPNGLMFQSDKGIWLLGRDLSTQYIGKDVEAYNSSIVTSAVLIPGTNQVRFGLNTGPVLLYDYFVGQWGTFSGVPSVSSTINNNLHTFVNSSGSIFQESIGSYLDGTVPVTMSFTTGWIDFAGLEGYERLYRAYMLANYISPHSLTIGVAYDYNSTITQTITINPDPTNPIEQWQLNFINQQCQAFQLTFTENYDPSVGPAAGAGLTMSGLKLVIGGKVQWPGNIPAKQRKS